MSKLDFSVVLAAWSPLLGGLMGTLFLALSSIALALCIGLIGVVLRRSRYRPVQLLVVAFVETVRNTPFLIQIFFMFFALPLIGLKLSPTLTALIALSLNGGAYAIEIIRGGVESVPKAQLEAGSALGLHRADVLRFIVLKPALRAIYPALSSQFVLLTLNTAVCTSISAYELTSVAQRIESETFRSFEVYFSITGMYLLISTLMIAMFALISRRYFNYPR